MNMKRCLAMAACCAMLTLPLSGWGQGQKPKMAVEGQPIPPAESLNAVLTIMEHQIVSAADAMPAEKYDFAPSVPGGEFTGVNTFAKHVRHLAQSNYEFFQGWGIPGEVDPKTLSSLKTKDELMKALRDSYKFAHAAVDSITPQNAFLSVTGPEAYKSTRASMAAFCMAHSMDHYGQMVEYLRMNGIIPPASRPGAQM
ncbi:putative damage-inducible protein DinB [Silvibacterium bohemicum]|uniref:Putative damage-inducible protein DinB n=1 Tax=Silvibacterium bohemicum TaxID=1577686 RepID=A0A841JVD8_9BACT|nr:DinB family protein [Silvibacterium bohemicum]MBB6142398.1 putative damage-inducible protein DinB [Silvibacterium bohemicum]